MKKLLLLIFLIPLLMAAGPISSGPISGSGSASVAETDPVAGAVTGIVKSNGSGAFSAATPGLDYSPALLPELAGHVSGTVLTTIQCSGTIINSYSRNGAVTLTFPAASSGLSCVFSVGTQHNSAWKIQRVGADTIIKDGNTGKTYIQETNQVVGSEISCHTIMTAAATWTWICTSIAGTWVTD